ncbi:MAG: maleylpyruvate isomerase family mycothiol-dependent enzyme, partial [Acidimicrobiales bacterium]
MRVDGSDQQTTIDTLISVWESIDHLVDQLDDTDWARPTDCPGWTVKDQLAHVTAIETQLAGRPQPEHVAPDAPWVRNDFGKITEVGVDYRRPWAPPETIAEFRDVIAERVEQLRALTPEEWAADSWTPVGPGTYGLFMAVRILDCWSHEQDMRRATGRPGNLGGPAPELATDRLLVAVPMVVGKRVAPPDGTSVVLRLVGPVERVVAIGVEGGRARRLDDEPPEPAATITMGSESYAVLANGRQEPSARGDVKVEGDAALGESILAN